MAWRCQDRSPTPLINGLGGGGGPWNQAECIHGSSLPVYGEDEINGIEGPRSFLPGNNSRESGTSKVAGKPGTGKDGHLRAFRSRKFFHLKHFLPTYLPVNQAFYMLLQRFLFPFTSFYFLLQRLVFPFTELSISFYRAFYFSLRRLLFPFTATSISFYRAFYFLLQSFLFPSTELSISFYGAFYFHPHRVLCSSTRVSISFCRAFYFLLHRRLFPSTALLFPSTEVAISFYRAYSAFYFLLQSLLFLTAPFISFYSAFYVLLQNLLFPSTQPSISFYRAFYFLLQSLLFPSTEPSISFYKAGSHKCTKLLFMSEFLQHATLRRNGTVLARISRVLLRIVIPTTTASSQRAP